jgi:hypothetical protein
MRGEDGKIEFLVSRVMMFCLMSLSLSLWNLPSNTRFLSEFWALGFCLIHGKTKESLGKLTELRD